MTYNGPTASDKDVVRFWLQDTDADDELLTDSEIQYLIDYWKPVHSSMVYIASLAAEVVAARFTREVSVSADGVSVATSELASRYQQLAAKLRDQAKEDSSAGVFPDVGGIMYDPRHDPFIKPLVFGVGFMDNPEAGRADYGDYDAAVAFENTDGLVEG